MCGIAGTLAANASAEPLIHTHYQPDRRSPFADELETAIGDGYRRLLAPALEV